MKIKKILKRNIVNILVSLFGIGIFTILFYLYFFEKLNPNIVQEHQIFFNILDAVIMISLVILIILYYKFGGSRTLINRFKSSKKVDISYNNFQDLYKSISNKLMSNNYKQHKVSITDKEKLYIFIKQEGSKISLFLLADLITYTDKKESIIKTKLEKFIERNISIKPKLQESLFLICAKRYSEELEEIIKETYFDGDPCMTFCLLFSTKKIYFASEKELRIVSNENYSNLVNRFFQIIN